MAAVSSPSNLKERIGFSTLVSKRSAISSVRSFSSAEVFATRRALSLARTQRLSGVRCMSTVAEKEATVPVEKFEYQAEVVIFLSSGKTSSWRNCESYQALLCDLRGLSHLARDVILRVHAVLKKTLYMRRCIVTFGNLQPHPCLLPLGCAGESIIGFDCPQSLQSQGGIP